MARIANVPYIANIESLSNNQIREVLTARAAEILLDSHNWSDEYPYAPTVTARVAVSDSHIALMFNVLEEHTKAVEMESNGRVWEDSCVEFFVANPVGEGYYNFELNAIGTLLAAFRTSRENATHFSVEQIAKIRRFGQFEHSPIDVVGQSSWWVAELIPFEAIGLSCRPRTLRANFYKCGDNLRRPHFMSWSPIALDKPNFHCPDYFGELIFDYE
ncbi:MAG: hypothetical protein IKY93_05885 [Alistipes sp.]|nr:hypothetical protein [Alistipes sp.]